MINYNEWYLDLRNVVCSPSKQICLDMYDVIINSIGEISVEGKNLRIGYIDSLINSGYMKEVSMLEYDLDDYYLDIRVLDNSSIPDNIYSIYMNLIYSKTLCVSSTNSIFNTLYYGGYLKRKN